MSDSSSEDDILEQLLESVDKNFLPDSLFSRKSEKENSECLKLPPSLRSRDDENNIFSETGITKSCQSFIAKKLSKHLDEQIEKLITHKYDKNSVSDLNHKSGGVLLFSNSDVYLSADDKSYNVVPKKKKIDHGISKAELKKRCKTIAVSSDWISSGAATKGWCKNTKGEVIHVKKLRTNGNSVECELIK